MDYDGFATFQGVRFGLKYEHGQQTACEPLCQNCGQKLVRYDMGTEHMLICETNNQGCTNPARRFGTMEETNEFLTTACRELEKRKS